MGTSRGDFHKYPRTPHLAGSDGTSDDKRLGAHDTQRLLNDDSLIVEEKLDGTNVGFHYSEGKLILQCRGHEITAGMHPQYDLFKQWVAAKRPQFEGALGERYLVYGEWLYARHSIHYRQLPHYFFEFDIYDKEDRVFLDWERRMVLLEPTGIHTVPVIHRGPATIEELQSLIGPSQFDAEFHNPTTGRMDARMEGVYVRIEADGQVTGRAKFVRPEFTERVKLSTHWKSQPMVPNQLVDSADIWT
jgi:hypothetical protein